MGSYHGCDCKGSVPAGGGEGARWGQITDATAKGPTTYTLEVERDGVISRMRLQREQGRRTRGKSAIFLVGGERYKKLQSKGGGMESCTHRFANTVIGAGDR